MKKMLKSAIVIIVCLLTAYLLIEQLEKHNIFRTSKTLEALKQEEIEYRKNILDYSKKYYSYYITIQRDFNFVKYTDNETFKVETLLFYLSTIKKNNIEISMIVINELTDTENDFSIAGYDENLDLTKWDLNDFKKEILNEAEKTITDNNNKKKRLLSFLEDCKKTLNLRNITSDEDIHKISVLITGTDLDLKEIEAQNRLLQQLKARINI